MAKVSNVLSLAPMIPAVLGTAINQFSKPLPTIQKMDDSKPQPPPELTNITHTTPTLKQSKASYYDLRGELTANGQFMDPKAMSCAHKTLPFGTILKVWRLDSGAITHVIVNDRGPFAPGRDLDLSLKAAHKLDMAHGDGIANVVYSVVGRTKDFAKFGAGVRSRNEIMSDDSLIESHTI